MFETLDHKVHATESRIGIKLVEENVSLARRRFFLYTRF